MILNHLFLTTGLLGLFGSANAQTSSIDANSVNIFLLGNENAVQSVTGAVLEVLETRTVYYVGCSATISDSQFIDPCPLIGGSVTHEPTRWEYDIRKQTEEVRGTGLGTFTAEIFKTTTGTIICDVTSNTATCKGTLTSSDATRDSTRIDSTTIDTTISDVTGNMIPVSITSGIEKLETTSTTSRTTSSSTGGAPMVTRQALLVGAAAIVGGVVML